MLFIAIIEAADLAAAMAAGVIWRAWRDCQKRDNYLLARASRHDA
jgi:hypothetical protein